MGERLVGTLTATAIVAEGGGAAYLGGSAAVAGELASGWCLPDREELAIVVVVAGELARGRRSPASSRMGGGTREEDGSAAGKKIECYDTRFLDSLPLQKRAHISQRRWR